MSDPVSLPKIDTSHLQPIYGLSRDPRMQAKVTSELLHAVQEVQDGWNTKNSNQLTTLVTDTAVFQDQSGTRYSGKVAISAFFANTMKVLAEGPTHLYRPYAIHINDTEHAEVSQNVDVRGLKLSANAPPIKLTVVTQTSFVKKDGHWLATDIELNFPPPAPPATNTPSATPTTAPAK